jgi:hypothetical protein
MEWGDCHSDLQLSHPPRRSPTEIGYRCRADLILSHPSSHPHPGWGGISTLCVDWTLVHMTEQRNSHTHTSKEGWSPVYKLNSGPLTVLASHTQHHWCCKQTFGMRSWSGWQILDHRQYIYVSDSLTEAVCTMGGQKWMEIWSWSFERENRMNLLYHVLHVCQTKEECGEMKQDRHNWCRTRRDQFLHGGSDGGGGRIDTVTFLDNIILIFDSKYRFVKYIYFLIPALLCGISNYNNCPPTYLQRLDHITNTHYTRHQTFLTQNHNPSITATARQCTIH